MAFSNKAYSFLKAVALVWLPAAGTLYFALAGIWGFPDVTQIIGSITAVDTALGGLLHISSKTYVPPTDGNLVVDKSDPAKDTYSLEVNTDLEEVQKAGKLLLKVIPKVMT